ncbi:MAG TPA: A24 family peptidase [Myxococcales bacterium]|nr:A24 family peptidase [Myxococcales bacterium]
MDSLVTEFTAAPVEAKISLIALAVALAISAITDVRERRILNAVTYPALTIAAACALSLGGLPLLLESTLGALICSTPLALAMWRGWMGAGDVKLMAVAGLVSGTAAGWTFSIIVLLDVAIAGGAQAALWLLAAKARHRDRPKSVPYGLAIALGATWAFLTGAPLF